MSKALDLTNQKFSKLLAIERAPKRNDKYTRWVCKCECGNIVEVRTDYLRNGHTTSCGCEKNKHFKKYDLQGKKFGRLTVIGSKPPEKQICQCDCGKVVEILTYNLTSGNTQSCGCLQRERTSESSYISLIGNRYGKLVVIERVENNRYNHICYKCKCDCGGETIVYANRLRQGVTNSCGCLKSKGEMIINNWLCNNNINFISQYSHPKIVLKSGRKPLFDFAIFNNDNKLLCLIEYNGEQHYRATGGWNTKEQLELTQNRDRQKREWCKKLNISLYEIKYDENIEKVLEGIIKDVAETPDMEEADGLEVE